VIKRTTLDMPRLNANDDSGLLVRWFKTPGQSVAAGDLVAQIETTKAAVDIEADAAGFFFPLLPPGARADVGKPIAWIAETYDHDALARERDSAAAPPPTGNRLISRKAAELMKQHVLEAKDIPGSGPINTGDVEKVLASRHTSGAATPLEAIDGLTVTDYSVVLFGAAMQGAVVIDCLRDSGAFAPLCFVDDRPADAAFEDLPVFLSAALPRLRERGVRYAHVCIGAPEAKLKAAEALKALGFEIVQAVHPRAMISSTAMLGEGVYVGPGVVIGPGASIGAYSQVNNNATVPHHVRIGVAVRISDGANIAGAVSIGDRTLIGLGVTVNTGCDIGADVTVMSGVSVFDRVPDGATVRVPVVRR